MSESNQTNTTAQFQEYQPIESAKKGNKKNYEPDEAIASQDRIRKR